MASTAGQWHALIYCYGQHRRAAVRCGKWKLIIHHLGLTGATTGWSDKGGEPLLKEGPPLSLDESVELYDLDSDPSETTNLESSRPKILKMMIGHLDAFKDSMPAILDPAEIGTDLTSEYVAGISGSVWTPFLQPTAYDYVPRIIPVKVLTVEEAAAAAEEAAAFAEADLAAPVVLPRSQAETNAMTEVACKKVLIHLGFEGEMPKDLKRFRQTVHRELMAAVANGGIPPVPPTKEVVTLPRSQTETNTLTEAACRTILSHLEFEGEMPMADDLDGFRLAVHEQMMQHSQNEMEKKIAAKEAALAAFAGTVAAPIPSQEEACAVIGGSDCPAAPLRPPAKAEEEVAAKLTHTL